MPQDTNRYRIEVDQQHPIRTRLVDIPIDWLGGNVVDTKAVMLRAVGGWQTEHPSEFRPGRHLMRLHTTYQDERVAGPFEVMLPIPDEFMRLPNADKNRVVYLLEEYAGSTLEMVSHHLETFSQHYRAEIGLEALREQTGYRLPAGAHEPRRADLGGD